MLGAGISRWDDTSYGFYVRDTPVGVGYGASLYNQMDDKDHLS